VKKPPWGSSACAPESTDSCPATLGGLHFDGEGDSVVPVDRQGLGDRHPPLFGPKRRARRVLLHQLIGGRRRDQRAAVRCRDRGRERERFAGARGDQVDLRLVFLSLVTGPLLTQQ